MPGPIMTAMLDGMEPQVADQLRKIVELDGKIANEVGNTAVLHSIAISLKRIADTLEKQLHHSYEIQATSEYNAR